MNILKKTFFTLSVVLLTASQAQAQLLINFDGTTPNTRNDGPYTVGDLFQVGPSPSVITALGIQDVGANGLANGSGAVGLWDATGTTLLASVTVTNADPTIGTYLFHTLSAPLTLSANTQYLIGAEVGGSNEQFLDGVPHFFAGSNFTLIQNRYNIGASLAAPLTDGTGPVGRWGPASALITSAAVPEPGSVALLAGIGVTGAAFLRRRKVSS